MQLPTDIFKVCVVVLKFWSFQVLTVTRLSLCELQTCLDIFIILGQLTIVNALAPMDDGRFRCLSCAKTFTAVANARRHVKEKHQEQNAESFQCHLCTATFRVQRYYHDHLSKKHDISQKMIKNSF